MKKIILILLVLLSFSCSQKPKIHYFSCNEQESNIVYTYFPLAINSLDYLVTKSSKDSNFIIASKPILVLNKVQGIEHHYIEIKFHFKFIPDTLKSEITQYYVVEMNGKRKIKNNNEQLKKYEKDIITLQEKLLFYCNPKFKGR
jgi:hypothetical protein